YDIYRDRARVVVSQDQLPLAIGKGGQNVRLSARLTRYKIDINENPKIQFDRLIFALVEELDTELISAGSTTLKRKILKKGIEPDTCYYIQNEPTIRGQETLNLETDPPPDLAIEIDITSSSVNKFNIYAALGVTELWRYDGSVLQFYQLVKSEYLEIQFSVAFPLISVIDMNKFIQQSKTMGEIALLKSFRAWVKEKIGEMDK
ncbi:MAG: hypothetical protein F6K62_20315, partial [Sphaerospermopsis sp. SIO1G2]|nr:hypothetical protein [Sphaerospermopsis sp. SIO1G2]